MCRKKRLSNILTLAQSAVRVKPIDDAFLAIHVSFSIVVDFIVFCNRLHNLFLIVSLGLFVVSIKILMHEMLSKSN